MPPKRQSEGAAPATPAPAPPVGDGDGGGDDAPVTPGASPANWRQSLSSMSRSVSKWSEETARELEKTTQEAKEALAVQTEAAKVAYRESGGLEAALERTSSTVVAATAATREAAAAALAAASEIEVTFDEPGPLGLSFGSVGQTIEQVGVPKVVIEIEAGGTASNIEDSPIEVGLELIKVQGYSCEQLSFAATLDLIRAGSRPLTLTFKRQLLFEKRPDWIDTTDWENATDVTSPRVAAVGVPSIEPEPEPEPVGPAPPLGEVSVGVAVRVRPDAEAEAACLAVGMKWNAARKRRACGDPGEISEVCEDGCEIRHILTAFNRIYPHLIVFGADLGSVLAAA